MSGEITKACEEARNLDAETRKIDAAQAYLFRVSWKRLSPKARDQIRQEVLESEHAFRFFASHSEFWRYVSAVIIEADDNI